MAAINLLSLTDEQKKNFFNSFDTVITDCDGVLWHSKVPVHGATKVMNSLPSFNKKRFFFSNNSTLTRAQSIEKLNNLGFDATEDEVLCTAWLTAQYLKNRNFKKKVYNIGTAAVKEELEKVGIRSIGFGSDNFVPNQSQVNSGIEYPTSVDLDPEVGAVLISYDLFFSYSKLLKGFFYLNDPNCLFIATDTDERIPLTENLATPGAGALVAALEKCTERQAEVMGKPSPLAVDKVLIPSGLNPYRTLMIGDRCNTDIHFGNQSDMITLLVETGVHKLSHLQGLMASNQNHLIPTYYTSSIADLLQIMKP